jgi:site-specific recombinase
MTSRPEGAHGPGAPDVSGPTEPDEIKADIEATRDQLAATVDELSHRLDVGSRAKEGAAQAKDTVVETYRENPPVAVGAVVAVVAAVVALVVWRSRR